MCLVKGKYKVPFSIKDYEDMVNDLISLGYENEIKWAQRVSEPADSDMFFCEYGFVVVNSGMKAQIAQNIWNKVVEILYSGGKVSEVFKHKLKAEAIQNMFDNRDSEFLKFKSLKSNSERFNYLKTLKFIGPITIYHLAKNYGMDFAKPDRHLVRIAEASNVKDLNKFCETLGNSLKHRIGTVDLVLWRASNLGLIDTMNLI